jgi:hypothetical protein
MGYTHYWSQTRFPTTEERDAILTDAQKMLNHLPPNIRICSWSGEGRAEMSQECINFNGDEQAMEAGENFRFPFREPSSRGFCKTHSLPYDLLVCGMLLSIARHMGDAFAFESDGNWRDWEEAITWWQSVFPARGLPAQVFKLWGAPASKVPMQVSREPQCSPIDTERIF